MELASYFASCLNSLRGLSESVAQQVLQYAIKCKKLNARTIQVKTWREGYFMLIPSQRLRLFFFQAFLPCGLQRIQFRSYDHASDKLCYALRSHAMLKGADGKAKCGGNVL